MDVNDRRASQQSNISVSSSGSDYELQFALSSFSTCGESDLERDTCSSTGSFRNKSQKKRLYKISESKSQKSGRHELCSAHGSDFGDLGQTGICDRFMKHYGLSAIDESKLDQVTQNLLSARKVKINELKSEVYELKIRVKELLQENRLLKQSHNRHEKELGKLEEQKADLPNIIKTHTEEVRVLKKHLQRAKERSRNSDYMLRRREDELEKVKVQLDKLNKLSKDKKLLSRDDLRNKLTDTLKELSSKNSDVKDLEKKLELTTKNHKYEMNLKMKKYKEVHSKMTKMQETINELQDLIKAKNNKLENQNIYSGRRQIKNKGIRKLSDPPVYTLSPNDLEHETRQKSMSSPPVPDRTTNEENLENSMDYGQRRQVAAWRTPEDLKLTKSPDEEKDILAPANYRLEVPQAHRSVPSPNIMSPKLANSASPISTGFNTPSTIIEMSPDSSAKDSPNDMSLKNKIEKSPDIIDLVLRNNTTDDKLTLYFSTANDDEQFYSDSSNSSSKLKQKYRFSRPTENLHRGRPAHFNRSVVEKSKYTFGSYSPTVGGTVNRDHNARSARKAKLMADLFGDKQSNATRCQQWLDGTSPTSPKEDVSMQNFGHSPFAYDEIAPRSRRAANVNDKAGMFPSIYNQKDL